MLLCCGNIGEAWLCTLNLLRKRNKIMFVLFFNRPIWNCCDYLVFLNRFYTCIYIYIYFYLILFLHVGAIGVLAGGEGSILLLWSCGGRDLGLDLDAWFLSTHVDIVFELHSS